jgi:uncharacterized integral membrane protein
MVKPPIDRTRRWTLRLMILAMILAIMVVFIAENFVVVEVRLVTRSVEARLAWVVLISSGIGVLGGLLLPWLWRRDTTP